MAANVAMSEEGIAIAAISVGRTRSAKQRAAVHRRSAAPFPTTIVFAARSSHDASAARARRAEHSGLDLADFERFEEFFQQDLAEFRRDRIIP